MKLKKLICPLLVAGLAGLVNTAVIAKDLKAQAQITRVEAEKIALEKVPGGKIKTEELEKEKGRLIWSFDVAVEGSKNLWEVEIDAITGEVVSLKEEKKRKKEKN